MMKTSKSYWQKVSVRNDGDKNAIKSWFQGTADDMTPYKAEVLCDKVTDHEKKIRAFMTDKEGRKYQFERTHGGRTFSVSMKRIYS